MPPTTNLGLRLPKEGANTSQTHERTPEDHPQCIPKRPEPPKGDRKERTTPEEQNLGALTKNRGEQCQAPPTHTPEGARQGKMVTIQRFSPQETKQQRKTTPGGRERSSPKFHHEKEVE
ncbi:hypothetical protein NDU88_001227 [Pleurodeles waltl]|uniref:Uncharacterized protein n=1 Tax=Pleurodeles waltl TaxID=8319 RepID=A0AAV7U5S9_PLEWA|nr:hypothetical protein NDU88_001227 [Pleurodeles waltl]